MALGKKIRKWFGKAAKKIARDADLPSTSTPAPAEKPQQQATGNVENNKHQSQHGVRMMADTTVQPSLVEQALGTKVLVKPHGNSVIWKKPGTGMHLIETNGESASTESGFNTMFPTVSGCTHNQSDFLLLPSDEILRLRRSSISEVSSFDGESRCSSDNASAHTSWTHASSILSHDGESQRQEAIQDAISGYFEPDSFTNNAESLPLIPPRESRSSENWELDDFDSHYGSDPGSLLAVETLSVVTSDAYIFDDHLDEFDFVDPGQDEDVIIPRTGSHTSLTSLPRATPAIESSSVVEVLFDSDSEEAVEKVLEEIQVKSAKVLEEHVEEVEEEHVEEVEEEDAEKEDAEKISVEDAEDVEEEPNHQLSRPFHVTSRFFVRDPLQTLAITPLSGIVKESSKSAPIFMVSPPGSQTELPESADSANSAKDERNDNEYVVDNDSDLGYRGYISWLAFMPPEIPPRVRIQPPSSPSSSSSSSEHESSEHSIAATGLSERVRVAFEELDAQTERINQLLERIEEIRESAYESGDVEVLQQMSDAFEGVDGVVPEGNMDA